MGGGLSHLGVLMAGYVHLLHTAVPCSIDFFFFFSNYNIPGVLSPSSSSVNASNRTARSYGSISGMRSGSFQRSNSASNIYIPGTTPPQLFSGSGYQPSVLVEQHNEEQ